MRRGFTVLELLVASLLLGMLMTILTMIFSQSSIAWRTGMATVMGGTQTRATLSKIRSDTDNAYAWNGESLCVRSVFDDATGEVRSDRQVGPFDSIAGASFSLPGTPASATPANSFGTGVGCGSGQTTPSKNYVINVMSCGPDRKPETRYDNIYSLPDDPNNW